MRVIAGKYKRRNLLWPDDTMHIRPTKDRIREAIFSSLGDIDGKVSLDLYSGSGSMGIEAISRGSSFCYFVDINPTALKITKQNLNSLKIDNAEVVALKDVDALNVFAQKGLKFDLVFLDPPYQEGQYQEILSLLLNNNLLNDQATIVLESDRVLQLNGNIIYRKDYKYGDIYVAIIKIEVTK